MRVYHLTTREAARKIIDTGVMNPGVFVGDRRLQGVFCSQDRYFDFIEADVILPNGYPKSLGVVLEFKTQRMVWQSDPEAHIYGPWVVHVTEKAIPVEIIGRYNLYNIWRYNT